MITQAATHIQTQEHQEALAAEYPTVWGLTPTELHDRFWAARGVQVVRQGERSEIVEDAELFLLISSHLLTSFRLRRLIEDLDWYRPELIWVRIRDDRDRGYRETAVVDARGKFLGFERSYGGSDSRLTRAAVTPHRRIARIWQSAPDERIGWQRLRREVHRNQRMANTVPGRTHDSTIGNQAMQFTLDLVQHWKHPNATIERAKRSSALNVWNDPDADTPPSVKFIGPAWVGAGRKLEEHTSVVGPAILWDDPDARPHVDAVQWGELEAMEVFERPVRNLADSSVRRIGKRTFDIFFACFALALVLPIFPVVMLAIYLEDGRPFFFAHRRETVGGKEFPCLKFRSMRKDAEQIKDQLTMQNQADGPQFYIKDDPRLTRVGRIIRLLQIDELPQFLNVLVGHMSIVGPRPSPFKENQYCPPWREARLSIRPGITGLWQVMRTRESGSDFQEWIRYDLDYVENASIRLDCWIIFKTILMIIRKGR